MLTAVSSPRLKCAVFLEITQGCDDRWCGFLRDPDV